MKKIFLILGLVILLSGCTKDNKPLQVLKLDKNSCKIIENIDTHGGFLGDGERFSKIECSKVNKKEWNNMPLPEELDEVLSMEICNDKECKNAYERYSIPKNKGYFIFIDRHSESKDKFDYKDINTRSSYNITMAIFDGLNTIYYYELDT